MYVNQQLYVGITPFFERIKFKSCKMMIKLGYNTIISSMLQAILGNSSNPFYKKIFKRVMDEISFL